MIDQVVPCEVKVGAVHIVLGAMQMFTAVLVAWLTNRAKKKDAEEKRRNGHNSVER